MGKSSAPPPPDYAAAAQQTAQGNLENMRATTRANRANQYTPYGSLTWSHNPTVSFDEEGYNRAYQTYQNSLNSGGTQGPINWADRRNVSADGTRPALAAPNRKDFETFDPDSGWEQRLTLNPEAQAALDEQLELNKKYGEVANIGFDRARSIFENPELDVGALPERGINVGQTAQDAILSRLNPQLQREDEALRTRLVNQGITLGSDAYGREMGLQGQRSNDLRMQAALQGINLDQANRSAALQEQAYLQDRPLNLINALRTGNQVQAPQFQQFAQQGYTPGPDMLGAANMQYQANVDRTNAKNAQTGGMLGGLFGLATAPMGGSMLGGLFGM